jgi:hypothetical protein
MLIRVGQASAKAHCRRTEKRTDDRGSGWHFGANNAVSEVMVLCF